MVSNVVCQAYYATALLNTQAPSFDDVKSKKTATYSTSLTQYGDFNLGSGLSENFTVKNLQPGLNWVLWIYAVNLVGVNSDTPFEVVYFTSQLKRTVFFSLEFTDSYLTDSEIDTIESSIHLMLSLDSSRLLKKLSLIHI